VGAIHTTVQHDVHGDAIAIAAMDLGTAGVCRAEPKPEFRVPQSRADTELEVRVGLSGES